VRLYRWTKRGFHDGRLIEAGDEVLCSDKVVPGAHMVDVWAEDEAAAPAVLAAAQPARDETLRNTPSFVTQYVKSSEAQIRALEEESLRPQRAAAEPKPDEPSNVVYFAFDKAAPVPATEPEIPLGPEPTGNLLRITAPDGTVLVWDAGLAQYVAEARPTMETDGR
jgi:hypothetical protein